MNWEVSSKQWISELVVLRSVARRESLIAPCNGPFRPIIYITRITSCGTKTSKIDHVRVFVAPQVALFRKVPLRVNSVKFPLAPGDPPYTRRLPLKARVAL